jgi:hypothetical protein
MVHLLLKETRIWTLTGKSDKQTLARAERALLQKSTQEITVRRFGVLPAVLMVKIYTIATSCMINTLRCKHTHWA